MRPGEADPHAERRRTIKENLKKNCPHLARQLEEDDEDETDQPGPLLVGQEEGSRVPQILDPSSSTWMEQEAPQFQDTQSVEQPETGQLVTHNPDTQHCKYIYIQGILIV